MRARLLLLLLATVAAALPTLAQSGGTAPSVDSPTPNVQARSDASLGATPGRYVDISGDVDLNERVYSLLLAQDGALYVGGGFTTPSGVPSNLVARLDVATGTWTALGTGMDVTGTTDAVSGLVEGPDGSLYAAGWFSSAGGVPVNNIARWDGTAWTPLGAGVNSALSSLTLAVDGTLYVGGYFTAAGGASASRVAEWSGAEWSALGSGIASTVRAVTVGPDGSLYAGGAFTSAGGSPVNYVARWDGAAWSPLGSGLNSFVRALAFGPNGHLYAGGLFTTAGGVEANRIARWDGSTWSPLGSGMTTPGSSVDALAFGPDGTLYAGGSFTTAGGEVARRVAEWDGTAWSPLGDGPDGNVYALTVLPSGDVVIGGDFLAAGGVESSFLTLWDADGIIADEPVPAGPRALTLGPNPTRGAATAWADVTGEATVTVHDALGRLIATPFAGAMAGRTAVRLPEELPPGVYVVRLAAGDAVQTARLVVVR